MVFDLLLMLFGELSAVEQPLRRGPGSFSRVCALVSNPSRRQLACFIVTQ